MTGRHPVRVTQRFFDRLDEILPTERTQDGQPSATDFLLHEMPAIIERLAIDYSRVTLPVDNEANLRVLITSGILVSHLAIYVTLAPDESVDVVGLEIDP